MLCIFFKKPYHKKLQQFLKRFHVGYIQLLRMMNILQAQMNKLVSSESDWTLKNNQSKICTNFNVKIIYSLPEEAYDSS